MPAPAQAFSYSDKTQSEEAVLIVDDVPQLLSLLKESLIQKGIKKIYKAATYRIALQKVNKYPIKVAIIDIVLNATDGVSLATEILEVNPEIKIIFHTGFDNEEWRARAVQLKIPVERWIDKSRGSIDKAARCVLEILSRQHLLILEQSISGIIRNASLTELNDEAIESLAKKLTQQLFVHPKLPAIEPPMLESRQKETTTDLLSLEGVLYDLKIYLNEINIGYQDIAHRTRAWAEFRKIVSGHLWDTCEAITPPHKYRRQLADQFEQAISTIEPHQLTDNHIEAVQLSLQYLSSDKVGRYDIRACEKAWRNSKVRTAPSFSEIVENWEEYYGGHDE